MKETLSQLSMLGASSKSSKSSLTLQTYNRTGILPDKHSNNQRTNILLELIQVTRIFSERCHFHQKLRKKQKKKIDKLSCTYVSMEDHFLFSIGR